MSRIIEIIVVCIFIGILILSIIFTKNENEARKEFKSSQQAALNSVLANDTFHIECVRCGWDNTRTVLWIKDSIK